MTHASPPPAHERFITLTPSAEDDDTDTVEVPTLVINPSAIATLDLLDEGTTIRIRLLNGEDYRITPLLKPRARSLFRDLLRGLGEKNSVLLPPSARVETGKDSD